MMMVQMGHWIMGHSLLPITCSAFFTFLNVAPPSYQISVTVMYRLRIAYRILVVCYGLLFVVGPGL